MEARFACTLEDYLEAQRAYKGTFSRYFFIVLGVTALVFALFVALTLTWTVGLPVGLAGLYCVLLPTVVLPLYCKRDFHRHPGFIEETLFLAKEEGLRVEAGTGHGEVNWSAFTKYQETPNLFILYMGARLFRIVPKRAFAPHDVDEFRNLLARHLVRK